MSEEEDEKKKERARLLEMVERAIQEMGEMREALLASLAARNEKQ